MFFVGLLPLQLLFLNVIKKKPIWVENYYSQGLYPFLFNVYHFFFEKVSFSIGDILYFLILIYLIICFSKIFRKRFMIKQFIISGLSIISFVIFLFYSSWGYNYYRLPLYKKLGYNIDYSEIEIENTLNILIKISNQLHIRLTNNDSLAVNIPYTKSKIASLIEKEFNFDLEIYKPKPYLKNSIWSNLISYMGYAGYLNPFTLESHINTKIPKLNYAFTAAHEMTHQLGIASESEANFIAFYTCIKNLDPFIKYSGYIFALNYCFNEFRIINPKKANKAIRKLNIGIKKNFKELSQFWKLYQNPFEPLIKKSYDSYLKANGQIHGIKSYDAMISLVIAYLRKGN